MKRFAITTAMCVLFPVGASVYGADPKVWNGDEDTDWHLCSDLADNWDGFGCNVPVSGDKVLIDIGSDQPVYSSTASISMLTIQLDADARGVDVSLQITAGTLSTTGRVTVKGKQGSSPSRTATLNPTADNAFAPASLFFWGKDDDTLSHAIFDVDADVTVGGISGTDTSFTGFVDVEMAPNADFLAKETYLVAGADVFVSHTAAGGGTFQATTLTIDNATLEVSNATVMTAD